MTKQINAKPKLIRWLTISAMLLLSAGTLLAAYMWWVVERFDTVTLPARHGGVDVELYWPKPSVNGGGARPLLVGLGGGEGGNAWTRGVWKRQRDRFLEQGYVFLALGYFATPNSPAQLDRISLDGVHAAIFQAARDARINARCVALIGGSRGGELALLLASHFPDIKTTVALVPGSAVFPALTDAMTTSGFSLANQPLPHVPMTWSATPHLLTGDLRAAFSSIMQDQAAMTRAAIAVENSAGPILFVSATQDEMWPSKEMSDAMMHRLQSKGFAHHFEHLVVEGGHGEPLDEFPKIEAFLNQHFLSTCQ